MDWLGHENLAFHLVWPTAEVPTQQIQIGKVKFISHMVNWKYGHGMNSDGASEISRVSTNGFLRYSNRNWKICDYLWALKMTGIFSKSIGLHPRKETAVSPLSETISWGFSKTYSNMFNNKYTANTYVLFILKFMQNWVDLKIVRPWPGDIKL